MTRWAVDFTPPGLPVIPFRAPDDGIVLLGDVDGIDMPPVDFDEQPLFDRQGAQLNNVRFGVREITVPIAVFGPSQQELRSKCRALCAQMNPRLGEGFLTLRADDGSDDGRVLFCRYEKGLEGTLEVFDIGDGWWACAPVFRAFDPYWRDAADQTEQFVTGATQDIPFFPMFSQVGNVGPHFGQVTASTSLNVVNDGDDVVFPRWVVRGPISNLLLTNESTGQAMDFSANGGLVLADTDIIAIDVENFPQIVNQIGLNMLPYLQAASVPFALGIGTNVISVSGSSIGAGSSVQLSFRRKFLAG